MNYPMELPFALGFERASGVIKAEAADFIVKEVLPEQASGEGEHLWLTVEKQGQNTAWVARQLASWAGISQREVSYAGLKDRHAITEQTFSLHLPGQKSPPIDTMNIEGVRVISSTRHHRKLKTGQLVGNHFQIRVRQCSLPVNLLRENWALACQVGVPNYFGPQRFGHGGLNIKKGADWLLGIAKVPRHQQSIYLSAVRSFLFNRLLAHRVVQGNWNQLIDGDFAQFTEGKAGFYCEQPAANDIERCSAGKLSPSASLPGLSKDEFEALDSRENEVLTEYRELLNALQSNKVMRHFRKLRVFPEQFHFEEMDGDPVFSFFLPAGSFATAVLSELIDLPFTIEAKDWHE